MSDESFGADEGEEPVIAIREPNPPAHAVNARGEVILTANKSEVARAAAEERAS